MDWGFGIGIGTLRAREWLATGDPLCRTGKSAQYSVMIYMGKESEREWMRVHV